MSAATRKAAAHVFLSSGMTDFTSDAATMPEVIASV
jgi:hypothetical protein